MPTKIEWCDETWNPVTGCSPASDGCKNCYASRMIGRNLPHMGHEGPFSRVQFHPDRLDQPLRWKKPRRIFVCSMGDLFHEDVKEEWINSVLRVAADTTRHTFMLLTKRPGRMSAYLNRKWDIPKNVWLGVTAENQATFDERIPILLQTPAAKRFVSVEPMLGPVDLGVYGHRMGSPKSAIRGVIDWVIVGGETGPGARPMHPDWARGLRDQCQAAGVPFFFKQWGEWKGELGTANWKGRIPLHSYGDGHVSRRVGKKAAGCLLDGREWKEFPALARKEEGS